jgi:hypothetical protein
MEYRYFVGCDFGTQNDYTAITLLERVVTSEKDLRDGYIVKYNMVHLERMRSVEYPMVVERIATLFTDVGLSEHGILVADATGLGLPIIQEIEKVRVPVVGISITGGHEVTKSTAGANMWNVPKAHLVTSLVMIFQSGRLRLAGKLPLTPVLQEELGNFGYKINKKTANTSYEAMVATTHDDLVISLAMAAWYASRKDKGAVPKRVKDIRKKQRKEYDPLKWGM